MKTTTTLGVPLQCQAFTSECPAKPLPISSRLLSPAGQHGGANHLGRQAVRRVSVIAAVVTGLISGVGDSRATIVEVASFPITYTPQGRIEVDVQLRGYSATAPVTIGNQGGGTYPMIFNCLPGGYSLAFNANNGVSGGGICGSVMTDISTGFTATTDRYWAGTTYGDILGNQQQVDGWHTYALVWNSAGLTTSDAANGHHTAVYIDGHLSSAVFRDDYPNGFPTGPAVLTIGGRAGQGDDPRDAAYDNLRVWNGVDTTTASLLLANEFEDQSLHSSVGPDGTYIAGRFIAGDLGSGQALMTAVPEPGQVAASLAMLVGVAGYGYRRSRPNKAA